MAELPVQRAAPNFVAATSRLPIRATFTALFDEAVRIVAVRGDSRKKQVEDPGCSNLGLACLPGCGVVTWQIPIDLQVITGRNGDQIAERGTIC
jgi:hypothetical protein